MQEKLLLLTTCQGLIHKKSNLFMKRSVTFSFRFSTDTERILVGRGGSLVDSAPFVRRVAISNPTLAAT